MTWLKAFFFRKQNFSFALHVICCSEETTETLKRPHLRIFFPTGLLLSLMHARAYTFDSASLAQTHGLLWGWICCHSLQSAVKWDSWPPRTRVFFQRLRVCVGVLRVCVSDWESLFNIREGRMKLGEMKGNKASRMVWWWAWITFIYVMLRPLSLCLSSLEVRLLSGMLTSSCSGILGCVFSFK